MSKKTPKGPTKGFCTNAVDQLHLDYLKRVIQTQNNLAAIALKELIALHKKSYLTPRRKGLREINDEDEEYEEVLLNNNKLYILMREYRENLIRLGGLDDDEDYFIYPYELD